jgi:hypothetical protein
LSLEASFEGWDGPFATCAEELVAVQKAKANTNPTVKTLDITLSIEQL